VSSSQYRSEMERKRKQRSEAEKKAGEYRSKESQKRSESAKARVAAAKASNGSTVQSKLRESERKDKEAESAGKEAGRWQTKAAGYMKDESALMTKLVNAERSERESAERKRKRDQQQADRRSLAERSALEARVSGSEVAVAQVLRAMPAPKPEKLRVLLLGASSEGDLRVGREQKRIRAAVESALHRNQIELDVRPAATTADLLDGISKFRPHVVHFSGHSNHELIVFEKETDEPHQGHVVTAEAFAKAVRATDDPPLLVLLNSCNSASQIDEVVTSVAPFAIGMADSIDDADAINYAAQFYAAVANGQSINSAHLSGQAALELAGLDSATLPTLACASDADPASTILVKPIHANE
jgi:hypothetical protein